MRRKTLGIVDLATRRRVTIAMIALGVVVFGLVAQSRLAVNLLPEMSYPSLTVRTELPGGAPQEIEYLLTRPVEEVLATVSGVRRVTSVSQAGQSDVTLEFAWGTGMDTAVVEVREKLDRITLPLEAERPLLLRFDPSTDPILRLSLGDGENGNLERLRRYAEDQLARDLETVEGVAAVRVSGGLDNEVQVLVDDDRMAALGLQIEDIRDRLEAENVNVSGGSLYEGSRELLVRTMNRFENLDDIEQTVVGRLEGNILRLSEIADVRMGHRDREAITRLNGEEAVEVGIYREGDANTVRVAELLRQRLDSVKGELPSGMDVAVIADQSQFIRQAVREVVSAGLIGGLLAALMLYLFLGSARPTFIIGVSIPLSVIGTFLLMHGTGLSLNVMSLGGIALAVGLLVDSAIVVLESIARRREAGDDALTAARRGTSEVGGAITASTLTTIAVFLPLIFVEGLAGQLFGDQALTITFSLLLALLIALAVIPMLSVPGQRPDGSDDPALNAEDRRGWLRRLPGRLVSGFFLTLMLLMRGAARAIASGMYGLLWPLRKGFNAVWNRVDRAYPSILAWSLGNAGKVWLITLAVVALALAVLPRMGTELIPEVSQGEYDMVIELPPGTDLERTDETLQSLRERLDGDPRIAVTASVAGTGNRLDAAPGDAGENHGQLTVRLNPGLGEAAEAATADVLRAALEGRDDIRHRIEAPAIMRFEQPLELTLRSDSLEALQAASDQAFAAIRQDGRFRDVRSSMAEGYPEVRIRFDRDQLASLGLDAGTVARRVADHVRGQTSSRYSLPERELDILVRGREETRCSLEALRALPINPGDERSLPLEAVADIRIETGPVEVRRHSQQRVAVISATPAGGDTGRASRGLAELADGLELPGGVTAQVSGQSDEMEAAFSAMQMALLLSIFLVYLVMASQFESLLHPFIILFTVPIALAGAILGLWVTGSTISVVVFIGLMMLGGIIVNNAIVLVDRINRNRADGLGLREAVTEAGQTRLRPILMTMLTTLLGLLPMALGLGEGGELRAPMAITVIGGLLVGTLLTLILIPVSYERVEYWLAARRRAQEASA
ncbi:HAE1 family hydrophobic/amphiphilic exporter-1 [Natronospira proteinivora]|uniref:HAE1 family hydrophobic/amphiphilic exporter-1 n=1 Tax=Natronospira proteinivora TaxID=1807133 RepID=A0ABT1G8Q7_9GAMM|nr:efflux RND transporter permease subunit [Natronospira proteinivora]MCP1727708.1 HAE1 family hydrophobic/amphiphilic exporter-1 [Natronospira proteinivora]